jgi:predicted Zn-dependent protease
MSFIRYLLDWTIQNLELIRVSICILFALSSVPASCATPTQSDPYVLKNRVIGLTYDYKFTAAQNAIDDYNRAADAKYATMVKSIELHYMPRSKLSPSAEEALQKVSSLDSVLANSRSLDLCKQCVRQYPQSEYAHIMLSRLYFWQLKDSLAVSEARKAVEIAPENLHALENHFNCCVYAHRKKDAAKVLSAIVKTDPRHQLGADFGATQGQSGGDDFFDPLIDRSALKKELKKEMEEELRNSGQ